MAIYAACAERSAPVLFHTGHPLPVLDTEASHPILIKDVVEEFPELPVWLGHAGAPVWWAEALEVAGAGPRVRLEMSVWLWDDSDEKAEIDFARKILQVGDCLGIDRLMFGTDHVSGAKVRGPDFLQKTMELYQRLPANAVRIGREISEGEMALIMGGVAARDLDWGTGLAP
jgi:predicted TIM-barrel fold metal-dependent hydrolase